MKEKEQKLLEKIDKTLLFLTSELSHLKEKISRSSDYKDIDVLRERMKSDFRSVTSDIREKQIKIEHSFINYERILNCADDCLRMVIRKSDEIIKKLDESIEKIDQKQLEKIADKAAYNTITAIQEFKEHYDTLKKFKDVINESNLDSLENLPSSKSVFDKRPIESLDLSVRTTNALKKNKIVLIRDLYGLKYEDLVRMPGVSKNMRMEIGNFMTDNKD